MSNSSEVIDNHILQKARQMCAHSGSPLMSCLTLISQREPQELLIPLANIFGMPTLNTHQMLDLSFAFEYLSLPIATRKQIALFKLHENESAQFIAAISDPTNLDIQTWLQTKVPHSIQFALALDIDIHAYLVKQEEKTSAVDQIASQSEAMSRKDVTIALSFTSVTTENNPAIKLANSTLYDGVKLGASDIHFETTATGLTIKYRIDGVLDNTTNVLGLDIAERVISRFKVLSELDISERRVPQDGSFKIKFDEREIDLRISIMPSIFGEDAVIRILDKRSIIEAYGALTLEALGFDPDSLKVLRQLSHEPYGMLMVTGPTGSGKTTTLYAALTEINNGREKIITIEDPIEYQLPGVLQISVNEKKGLTFAKGLRSVLRHDPDKIMVGEIRDRETSEIAVQSALTGHLVLTTVHANNVFDVFGRFTHLGTDMYAFASALNGVWAQRLIRLNCPHCSEKYLPSDFELSRVNLRKETTTNYIFMRGQGCGLCRGTGYKGRKAIAEILVLNDEIRELIVDKQPIRQIKELAKKNGTRSLREAALELIKTGETTLDEIKRVTLNA